MAVYVLVSILFLLSVARATVNLNLLSEEVIDYINTNQNLWIAGRNFHPDTPMPYLKRLLGTLRDEDVSHLPRKRYVGRKKLPKHFDARRKWQNCSSLKEIRDQGSCGSCWAVSAVSSMTDRFCISSAGRKNFYFSADDVLTCCRSCGTGCDGGKLSGAWTYTHFNGTVSGGSYHTRMGCKPYEIPPCEHDTDGPRPQCSGNELTPVCHRVCQVSYLKSYSDDKTKIGRPYVLKTKRDFKRDIYDNGPITVSFNVYEDFFDYKSGIYRYKWGKYMGDHSVKLLGWGEERGVKYWLAANSWNTDWGNRGFFKILRGRNHCGIEEHAVAAPVRV